MAVVAQDPVSRTNNIFTDVGALHDAIKLHGYTPIRATGEPFVLTEFQGGYLLDGAPINVWMSMGWFEGQKEALTPYWQNNTIPTPTTNVLGQPVVAMPPEVAANFQAFVAAQSSGIPSWALYGGAALAAWWFLK